MDMLELIQTSGAIPGLMCLMMVLLATKKHLKHCCK